MVKGSKSPSTNVLASMLSLLHTGGLKNQHLWRQMSFETRLLESSIQIL